MLEGSNVTLCYHSLNLVVHVVGGANKHRKHLGPRPSTCALSAKQSSLVPRNEGSSNHPESVSLPTGAGLNAPVLSLANTVGVIGGASSSSTLNFLEKLVACGTTHGDESIPFIVCSDPVLNRQLSSHERGSIPSLTSRSAQSQFDPRLVVENLRHKRLFLERSGARCIVMPCHISHSWHTEISEGCSVPFLHVGECVAEELKAANLKPVEAGSNLRIGLLATSATLTAGFYQEKLQNQGFEVVLPDKATMEHTVIPAIEAYDRKDIEGARNLLRIGLQVLLVRAVNTIILASDDMRGLLPEDDLLLKKCIDPMDAMVRSTMQWANSRENLKDKL